MATLLRRHVATSQVDLAMADMAALEKSGGGAGLTRLYVNLGKLLQKEMDALKKKGDSAGLRRTQQAYSKFLGALVASPSGQTFESLEWAGENLLALGNAPEAEAVFRRILDTFNKPDAKPKPLAPEQGLRTRLKLAAALREQGKHDEDKEILVCAGARVSALHRGDHGQGVMDRGDGPDSVLTKDRVLPRWPGKRARK